MSPFINLKLLVIINILSCVFCVYIDEDVLFSAEGSPYSFTEDIFIGTTGRLNLEPGITLKFDPGVGITVKGVLTAQGDADRPITLTTSLPPTTDETPPSLRLIDGPAPTRGRLQIYYNNKWRSICTNSKNWTIADRQVACRQMGFTGGFFYEWQDRPNNDTATLLYESPTCTGHEQNLMQCSHWQDRAMAGGVCDMHPDMGLACDEYHALWRGTNHWRGIFFEDAKSTQEKVMDHMLFQKVSQSLLRHVVIEYAGMGPKRELTAGVGSFKVPPRLEHVTVTKNAYSGMNFTLPDTLVNVTSCTVTHNRGIGIYVNSTMGSVSIEKSTVVSDNMADGIKFNLHHREPDLADSEQYLDFCSGPTNPSQTYPLITVARQARISYHEKTCERRFYSEDDHDIVYTVQFMYVQVDAQETASIEVRERDRSGPILTQFAIRNDTYPTSVVSRTNGIHIKFKAEPRSQVIIYMQVIAHKYKIPDISLNETVVERNLGHGVSVDNMRNLVLIHKSNLTDNIFGSGLNIRGGAGDVNVTYSTVTNNIGDGINVTYEGGRQNVTWSTVSNNLGRGVSVWFNETAETNVIHQETGVAYTTISKNVDVGVLVGNFCRNAFVNISSNYFHEGIQTALKVESCWNRGQDMRSLLIAHNLFTNNHRGAISIEPAVKMDLIMEWNEFHKNQLSTVTIFNEERLELSELPFKGTLKENTFMGNTGRYVTLLSLNLRNDRQSLFVTRNTIKRNIITEAYPTIASRTMASGVVCLGSPNVKLYRNLLENPLSLYELSSRTLDQSSPINASYNWLGTKDEVELFDRVLDRRDRYTLALIEFHPFLLSDNNMDTPVISPPQYSEPNFFNPEDDKQIGGEVNGNIVLTKDFYNVVRDIYVHYTGILTIPFGTTLEFAEGVGMMVTGTLRTEGSGDKRVRFTLSGTTEKEKIKALIEAGHIDDIPDNMTTASPLQEDLEFENITQLEPEASLKLVGGRDELEGRLMVYIGGVWGTVCNHGWTEDAAAVACQQMGYVLNPEDWYLEQGEIPVMGTNDPTLMSNVQCDEFHTDLLSCEYDGSSEIENSCGRNDDVGLRCYPRTWAGIRLGMTAHESHMKGVIIEKAGLVDYSSRQFKPALQVDFNQHVLQELTVQDNSQDGIGVIFNNQYAITNPESRLFRDCLIRGNRRHGISFNQLGSNITGSRILDNVDSGVHFNPFIRRDQQRELTGWMKLRQSDYFHIPSVSETIELTKDRNRVFITDDLRDQKEMDSTFTVTTSHTNVIGIQVLSPIYAGSTETIAIYDYPQVIYSEDVSRWSFKDDLTVFPTTSSSYAITIQYSSGNHAIGDCIFVLTAVDRRDISQDGNMTNFRSKVPIVFIEDSKIYRNSIGLSTLHYNRYLTDDEDILLRNGNETIALIRSLIVDNKKSAVHTLSPFRTAMDNNRIGEITFMFNDTVISRNGRGIEQKSWDERESNNLFHWSFDNVTVEGNGGGLIISLPYVWQYNENFTHTVYVNKSKFIDNADFEFTIGGQFARVNVSESRFERNVCSKGVFAVRGMEKEMFIRDNTIKYNIGTYMVLFNADSQSAILGNVYAYFENNQVQSNRHRSHESSDTAAIVVKGLQRVNITYNLFGENEMDYELLAGLYTARVEDTLNVRANWWGSREVTIIRERIFDFDDWNNFAVALFEPYLSDSSFHARVVHAKGSESTYVMDDTLGGRITEDILLHRRSEPYIVRSDLTVMPGATLRIEPGVALEFFPSVGMLVLGKLEAIGRRDQRIIMRPVDTQKTTRYRVGRQIQRHNDVRLCIEGECDGRRDGFLDLYNATTQQWIPICDNRFTERNAQVVCHQLGYNKINVFYFMDKRTEMFPNALTRVRSWPDPIQCSGKENRLDDCPVRMNGQIFDHNYECPWNEDFVYIHCGDLNLPSEDFEYWGGVRFSIPDFESSNLYDRLHEPHATHVHHSHEKHVDPSVLAWVDIIGAGILHNEKSPAVMSFYETPTLLDVAVSNSAYDGVSLVSALEPFEMLHNRFENNLGVGVSLMGLTGETRESDESSYTPIQKLRLPYHMFGMVDICDSSKELVIEERVLLYYKYDNKPIDCVKIFSSAYDVKKFGFRLMQFNLFNSTMEDLVPDRLIIYDGDIYNETTKEIAEFNATSTNSMRFIKTKTTRMSVQLHATGASGDYGFVAEVVTLPVSTIGIDRDLLQNLTYNQYYNNQEGAIFATTAGEVNPWLTVAWSRMEHNGRYLYGNITTSQAAANMDLQNMRTLYFKNNLVRNNTGGLRILAGSLGAATKLWANITNNLFCENVHWPSLYMESKPRSSYQQALVSYNDFSWSYSPYHDVIALAQIVSDFSYNYVHSNLGRHIFDVYGFEKVRLPVYQTTSHNSFAKNRAVDPAYPGTIVAGSAGQQYVDNVFYNLENAYEMVAVNETVRCFTSDECDGMASMIGFHGSWNSYRTDVWKTPIDARNNWWGFNTTAAVSGRIHDKLDDEKLLKVNYHPWAMNNKTLLHGCEPGYNTVGSSCYLYVGAPMTYAEAKQFCRRDNGSLPFLQRDFNEVRKWVKLQQPEYIWDYDMIWVQHYDIINGCAAFVDYKVHSVNCDLNLPFICESDQDSTIDATAWVSDTLVIGAVTATIFCIFAVAACVACWACKSKHRRKERLMRRHSIRASIRSNRSVLSLTSAGFSEAGSRARIIEEEVRPQAVKGATGNNGTLQSNGHSSSFDSIAKSNYNYSVDEDPGYMVYDTNQPTFSRNNDQRYDHRDRFAQPTFDLAFTNNAFRDTSTIGSMDHSVFESAPDTQPNGSTHDDRVSRCSTFSTYSTRPVDPPPSPPMMSFGGVNKPKQKPHYDGFPTSTPSSFRDRSIGGSTTHLGVVAAQDIIDLHNASDIHNAATLPRDITPSQKFVSVDILRDNTDKGQSNFDQGLSQSQPLETAM